MPTTVRVDAVTELDAQADRALSAWDTHQKDCPRCPQPCPTEQRLWKAYEKAEALLLDARVEQAFG